MITQGPTGRAPIVVGTIEVTLASLVAGRRVRNLTGEHVRVNIGDTRHVSYDELERIVSACWDAGLIEVVGADPYAVTSTADYLRRRLADVVPW
jgi:hypothetical protein